MNATFEDHPTDPDRVILRKKPRIDQGPDYERGFIDGMQYQMQSSVDKAVNAMAEAALKKFGRIDYLVNNAALRQEKSIEEMTFEDWRLINGIIVDGAFHCVKACLEAIKKSDAGSILNIGGLTGAMGAPDRAHVVTAKAGLDGFTRALAVELVA